MNRLEPPAGRDRENSDPRELNRPIPKILIALIVLLLVWAVYYIAKQAPGLESSSQPRPVQPLTTAAARAG
jgi:hypothetical protein